MDRATMTSPNHALQAAPVGVVSSADADHVVVPAWLSLGRSAKAMKATCLLILTAATCYGQFDNRLKSMPRADVPTVDINRMFGAYEWQIRISDAAVKRVDVTLSLQDEVLVETWLIDEQSDPERILDLAIGPLNDIDFGKKWRIYAGIRGRSAWWNRTIDIPKAAIGRKSSMAGGPVLQDDGTFGLVYFEIPTDKGVIRVPLKVRVTLSTTKEKPNKAVDLTATRVTPPVSSLRSVQESRRGQP